MRTPWRSVIAPDRWKLNLSAHDQCELYDLNSRSRGIEQPV